MKKKKTKIIIIVACTIVILLVSFYKSGSKDQPVETNLSSSGTSQTGILNTEEQNDDTSFLNTLEYLKSMQIDASIFVNSSFKSLSDNTVIIDSNRTIGRSNPFSSIPGSQSRLIVVQEEKESSEETKE